MIIARSFIAAGAAVALAAPGVADHWACPSDGDYCDTSNWWTGWCPPTEACCPGNAEELPNNAFFRQEAAYTVSFSCNDWACNSDVSDGGNVVFDLNQHTFAVTGCNPTFQVGYSSVAELTIVDGTLETSGMFVGDQAVGQGVLNIGLDGELDAGSVLLGREGSGILNVYENGMLSAADNLVVGSMSGGYGEANLLDGVEASASWVSIGSDDATGLLQILDGSQLTSDDAAIADSGGDEADVLIAGAASRWTISGTDAAFISISCRGIDCQKSSGNGAVRLENGAQFVVQDAPVKVGPPGSLAGVGTFGGEYLVWGSVDPGASVGTLTFDGDYTQKSSGEMHIEIEPGSSDAIVVTGAATLDGTLQISLLDGPFPAVGETFEIVAAANVSGAFSQVVESGPVDFDVQYNATSVVVEVIEGPPCEGDLGTPADVVNSDDLFILLGDWGPCAGCSSDLDGSGDVNSDDLFTLLGNWGACG